LVRFTNWNRAVKYNLRLSHCWTASEVDMHKVDKSRPWNPEAW